MTSESLLPEMRMLGLVKRTRVDDWNWRNGGAFFGICGGLLSPLLGSTLTAITWFTGPQWHGLFLQRDGTVLLFLTIPLLIFGAHCLDLEDQQERKLKTTLNNQIG
jgi:hypothetical protein